ncbi:MAG: hypothetical protein ACKVJ7_06600 [Candidatus Poseidoniales archaeon]
MSMAANDERSIRTTRERESLTFLFNIELFKEAGLVALDGSYMVDTS